MDISFSSESADITSCQVLGEYVSKKSLYGCFVCLIISLSALFWREDPALKDSGVDNL